MKNKSLGFSVAAEEEAAGGAVWTLRLDPPFLALLDEYAKRHHLIGKDKEEEPLLSRVFALGEILARARRDRRR
jgi:hypothetical protein